MVLKITPRIPNEVRPSSDFCEIFPKIGCKKTQAHDEWMDPDRDF